ncbi:MAG: hypothetical protein HUJ29_07565, partial [Gammaproteobacteria bacterium]|nr:hypothetical protein [Gammaproteobacteria bacterium]
MRLSIFLFLCTVSVLAQAEQERESNWRGTPFSSLDRTMQMPQDWKAMPVSYPEAIADADLVISLGQQTYPALRSIVEAYAHEHGMKIVIQSGTCGISAGKLLRKKVDSGAFCCPPGRNDRLPGLEFHTVAISPIAIIVNEKNPIEGISVEQARQVFRGKIHNWSQLMPNTRFDNVIKTVGRLHCKTRPGHWTLLLKDQESFSPKLTEVGVIPDLVAKVGQETYSISLETPFMVKEYDKQSRVKMLKIDGHSPADIEHVASGRYPFYRTYNLTTWSDKPEKREQTLALIDYLRDYIERHHQQFGFVPLSRLKEAGWVFADGELVGEPNG